MYKVLEHLMERLAFVPKGEEAGAAQQVIRRGKAMRPLAPQKTDWNIVAAATARTLKLAFKASATPEQRGVIQRRSLTYNVVELDLEARKLSMVADAISFLARFFV